MTLDRSPGHATFTSGRHARAVGSATRAARRVPPRRALDRAGRAGLVARGVLYGIIGILALKLAIGSGGKAASQQGALQTVVDQPFGKGLLIAIAIGLGGYSLWRLFEGAFAPRGQEALDRVSALASGIVYAVLCFAAIEILAGSRPSGGSQSSRHAAAGILGWTGGVVIVAIIGIVLAIVGLYQGYKGISRSFLDDADTARMSPRERAAFTALGVFGYLARAVIFLMIGYGVVKAAVDYSPSHAIGLDGALRHLQHGAGGPWALGIVAAGFVGFGLYSIADSRYHKAS